MSEQYNPFTENRTEQMKDLFKYYVPFDTSLQDAGKPIIVSGGRGSGKTMFFRCNSWRDKCIELQKNKITISDLLKENSIGIYYRVDTSFVSAMDRGGEDDWQGIFETYLSISILLEVLGLINEISTSMSIDEQRLNSFAKKFSRKLCNGKTVDSVSDFEELCDLCLDAIEDKINGKGDYSEMRIVVANRFIRDVCIAAGDLLDYTGLFKIYIDEYETLLVYQQRIVNTLIKHSSLPVIFNVGMKPHGMHTPKTISETETIEEPHDYQSVNFSFENSEEYFSLLKRISGKRIELGKIQGKIPSEASEEIQYYLGTYSIEEELKRIEKSKNLSIKSELRKLIQERCYEERITDELTQEYIRVLCDEADVLHARIHYALIKKRTQYSQRISDVYDTLNNNPRAYNEWIHNRKSGAIFLLCKETKRRKMYFGFDAYAKLSSSNVRSFLELCEQAFNFSFLEGFQWESPISEETQTEAAYYVSDSKIKEIARYKYGKNFRIFTQYLGGIFNTLHTDKDTTLGEPEPNHFSTEDLSLSDDVEEKIKLALLYNIIQEEEPTKKKSRENSTETVDYYLNKIYSPHFGISYRDIRKIHLPHELLELLLDGNEKDAIKARNQYFSKQKVDDFNPGQISILDIALEE